MTKEYYVEVPFTGKIMICGIKAESSEEALNEVFSSPIEVHVKDPDGKFYSVDWEWDMHEKVCRGNVFYGISNEAYVEEE